jgi:TonB-linked SusC/RagA family outer membrane protein
MFRFLDFLTLNGFFMKINPLLTCLRNQVRYVLSSTFLIFLLCATSLAQQRAVTGTITSALDNSPLPGVYVLVKGTTTGTVTDVNGAFTITAPSRESVLVISFVGFNTEEILVGDQSVINVAMAENVQQLGEVVVTALGVERNAKSLQSSITKVSGGNFTQARENNLGAAIQGRVAGVNVSKPSSGPAGSSRVIIRGAKSLQGQNSPLYVVDGIPMDNSIGDQAGVWGGYDHGDGLSSINPDDIESITVLKGASATALYGSRGGYGVINITTKKGTARKGIGIEYNTNYVFERAIDYTDLQHVYGQGDLANSDPNDPSSPRVGSKPATQAQAFDWGTSSWGAKLDGQPNIMWDGKVRPYSYAGNNWNRFYITGNSWTNSFALTGGNEKQSFRFSYSNLVSNSILRNSGFNRDNLSLVTNGKFGNKVTFIAKVMYSNEYAKNRPLISDSPGNAPQGLLRLPPNYNVDDLKGDPNKLGAVPLGVETVDNKLTGYEYQISYDLWNQNPWWAAYQFVHNSIRDRVITSGQLRYDITSFLYVQGKIGMDWYAQKRKQLDAPQGTGYQIGGAAEEREDQVKEINMEWMAGFNKAFGKINVNAFVGGNRMVNKSENVSAGGQDFNIPFYTSVNNLKSQSFGYGYTGYGINSLFGSAEVSYGGYLFITGTARNDWFSVLNPKSNSKLYPSIGGSFVFTDAFSNLPKILSFGKIRAAWSQVATATVGAYNVNLTYTLQGQGHLGRPLGDYNNGNGTIGGNIPNPDLVPALSTELEFGTELRFLQNRLGLDLTYYDQKTTDDILDATISIGSGFSTTSINVGKLSNKGVEILLTGTPVKGPITWDVSLNLAKNKNKVIYLNAGINEVTVEEPRTRTVFVKHIVGHPFGMLTGWVQKRDAAGNRMFDSQGKPVQSDAYEILGNGVPDLTGGFNNSLTWKQFNLSFLIDFKFGGDIYSGTNVRFLQAGQSKESLIGRDGNLKVTGVFEDANNPGTYSAVETRQLTIEQAENYWQALGDRDEAHFIYNASYLKLRQITFGYDLPTSLLSKTPFKTLGLSFVARNLAILYKNTPNIDPESTYTSTNAQGLDYYGMPATRTYGFNLKVTF